MSADADARLGLAHGNGGRLMRELIEDTIRPRLGGAALDSSRDAVTLTLPTNTLVTCTDGFIVEPLEFPGGDIGTLAVNGTLNDLAVAGARGIFLTLDVIAEEGLSTAVFARIMDSIGRTAAASGVRVVAGDTKVVPRGHGGGLYLATTGIGTPMGGAGAPPLGLETIRAGDQVLVSGSVGDHGTAVLLAREAFGLRGQVASDCAAVWPLAEAALAVDGLRFMRDPTRGGVATVMHELVSATRLDATLWESELPVRSDVRAVCDMLGFDPLFLACEGRVVAVACAQVADRLLAAWRSLPDGRNAAIVGAFSDRSSPARSPRLTLRTHLGGERLIDELEDDPLPRIC